MVKLQIWWMWSTLSLPLPPGPLWHGVIVSVEVPSLSQIDLFKNYFCLIGLSTKNKKFLDNVAKNINEYTMYNQVIGLEGRVFTNGPGDLGSIPGHVIPKAFKMVLDTSLLNTQRYKVCIKGKVAQSRERSSTPYITV